MWKCILNNFWKNKHPSHKKSRIHSLLQWEFTNATHLNSKWHFMFVQTNFQATNKTFLRLRIVEVGKRCIPIDSASLESYHKVKVIISPVGTDSFVRNQYFLIGLLATKNNNFCHVFFNQEQLADQFHNQGCLIILTYFL